MNGSTRVVALPPGIMPKALARVLIGWLVFGERMTRGKALAALVIVSGVMLTRL